MDLFFAFYAVFAGFAVVDGQDDSALTHSRFALFVHQVAAEGKV